MARERQNKTLFSYPPDLGDQTVHPAAIEFKFFERRSPTDSAPLNTIHLYMPESVTQPSTVDWGESNLGFVGNAIVKGARGIANLSGGFGEGPSIDKIGAALGDAGQLATAYGLANLGSAAASLMGGNVTAEGLMGAVAGVVPNPYVTALFRAVSLREFAFVFKFYPFQESDCQEIYDIISVFRENALPSYSKDVLGSGTNKALLGFPSECEIRYLWQGKDNEWIQKFKRSVCTTIDIDYTGQGMFSTMRNGFPSEITLSTKWKELEIVTREDIKDGY